MQSEELIFQLSDEDEQVVRTYKCTTLKRWFNPPTVGYLTVTNRRVVFSQHRQIHNWRQLLVK